MCAAVTSDIGKKKIKTKSVLHFFTRIVSPKMLKTDAVPMDNQQNLPATNGLSSEHQLPVIPSSVDAITLTTTTTTIPMHMVHNLNRTNQNLTIVESQQNMNFNNIQGLHVGNAYHFPGRRSRKNSFNGSYEDKAIYKKKKSTIELMNCTDLIDAPTMRIAAKSIGENWRMVFRDLLIPNPNSKIEQIKEQYFHISIEEVIYQLLLRWQRESHDPSIGKLSTVLWKNENYECLRELKQYYRNLKKSQANSVIESTEPSEPQSDEKHFYDKELE